MAGHVRSASDSSGRQFPVGPCAVRPRAVSPFAATSKGSLRPEYPAGPRQPVRRKPLRCQHLRRQHLCRQPLRRQPLRRQPWRRQPLRQSLLRELMRSQLVRRQPVRSVLSASTRAPSSVPRGVWHRTSEGDGVGGSAAAAAACRRRDVALAMRCRRHGRLCVLVLLLTVYAGALLLLLALPALEPYRGEAEANYKFAILDVSVYGKTVAGRAAAEVAAEAAAAAVSAAEWAARRRGRRAASGGVAAAAPRVVPPHGVPAAAARACRARLFPGLRQHLAALPAAAGLRHPAQLKVPIALLPFPLCDLRLLAGVYTGSVYHDHGLLKNGFPAEGVVNGSVAVVKTHEWGEAARRPFARALLLVRAPAAAILAEFNRQSGGHVGHAAPDRYRRNGGKYWQQFVRDKLAVWRATNLDWAVNFKGPALVLHYEALVRDPGPPLRRVLRFLGLSANESDVRRAGAGALRPVLGQDEAALAREQEGVLAALAAGAALAGRGRAHHPAAARQLTAHRPAPLRAPRPPGPRQPTLAHPCPQGPLAHARRHLHGAPTQAVPAVAVQQGLGLNRDEKPPKSFELEGDNYCYVSLNC
ncbi:WSCD family member AAEL009094 [Gryllus bimaculatus]|nr:WSCD family member AAEL009094 [Gryllus bimaculatus]